MKVERKKFNTFRQGRINARSESRKQLVLRNNLEKSIAPKINTAFRQFVKSASNEYETFQELNADQLKIQLNAKLEVILHKHYEKIFKVIFSNNEEFYQRTMKANDVFVFGRSFDFERLIQDYIRSRNPLFTGKTKKIRNKIQNIIINGRIDDLTLDQITRQITKKGYKISRRRANLIARTETHNAASYANNEYHKKVQQDLGTSMKKQWVATNDGRTRSAHSSANGQQVDMDEDFTIGGVPMEYAGDPKGGARNVVNCRCIIIYVEAEDTIEDSYSSVTVDDKPATLISDDDIDISPENQARVLGTFVPLNTPPEKIRQLIREATQANKVTIDKVYGATLPKELEWHKSINHWIGETNIINSLKKVSPLKKIINKGSTPNFSFANGTPTINMARAKSTKNKVSLVTWRHEYGHHIDFDQKLVDKYALQRTAFNRQGSDSISRGLSREASNDVIEDSVLLLKQKKEAEKRLRLYYSKDLTDLEIDRLLESVNFNDKVFSDKFLKKLGLAVQQKEFRDELIEGITRRRRVGLAEKLQRNASIDDLQNNLRKLIDNSPNSPLKFADLQKILGDDFVLQLDKLGSQGYKFLVDIVSKLESGYQNTLYNQLVVMAKKLTKNKHEFAMEGLYFSDYLGSISRSKFTRGHGKHYYTNTGGFDFDYRIPVNIDKLSPQAKILLQEEFGGSVVQAMTTEAFANYISLLGGSNSKYWRRLMMQYAPATTKKFDEIIKFINTTQI